MLSSNLQWLFCLLGVVCSSLAYPSRYYTDRDIKLFYDILMSQLQSQQVVGNNCTTFGLSPGCCVGQDCYVQGSEPGRGCSCIEACKEEGNCCADVPDNFTCSAATPAPLEHTPSSCVAGMNRNEGGCCNGSSADCRVMNGDNNELCYCDLMCHAMNNCCSDIKKIGCLPIYNNCSEAHKTNCTTGDGETCKINVLNGSCYCDESCNTRASEDCCSDARQEVQPPDISKSMRMEQLMSYYFRLRNRMQVSSLKQRLANLLARMQEYEEERALLQYYYHE